MIIFKTYLTLFVGVLFFALEANGVTIQKKPVPVTGIYSPRGYDTYDSAEIVVTGYLPNGCYKNPKVEINSNGSFIDLKVTSLHYGNTTTYCSEAIFPFVKTVDLGTLKAGEYKIRHYTNYRIDRQVKFKVKEVDFSEEKNQIYANVEHIERYPSENTLVLFGHNPSDCFVLDEIKVVNNKRKTITILPRMKKVSDFCPMKMQPFQYKLNIPRDDREESTLIHVRAMYGNSVNTLY